MVSIKQQIARCRSIVHNSGIIFLNVDYVLFVRFYYKLKVFFI